MKNILILSVFTFSLFTSLSSFASSTNCEEETYTVSWHDYDSAWNDSCKNFIKAAMIKKGCDTKVLKRLSWSEVTSVRQGSSLVCIYNSEGGIYQVMSSEMAEPHRALLLYSRLD
ncbi:hypothetical protein A9Q84_18160 [Halobacteriovorax marinus]|uniref:Lipoprotein n=1 Tax=Halobacteriovorax marinus TaxID=97084 RepID=A0A1Y5F8W8_9BACT|nr:hypothetical protein A9Q84_18160 [Halobacteriovorax marinus]